MNLNDERQLKKKKFPPLQVIGVTIGNKFRFYLKLIMQLLSIQKIYNNTIMRNTSAFKSLRLFLFFPNLQI
jgi:hypothetical protein